MGDAVPLTQPGQEPRDARRPYVAEPGFLISWFSRGPVVVMPSPCDLSGVLPGQGGARTTGQGSRRNEARKWSPLRLHRGLTRGLWACSEAAGGTLSLHVPVHAACGAAKPASQIRVPLRQAEAPLNSENASQITGKKGKQCRGSPPQKSPRGLRVIQHSLPFFPHVLCPMLCPRDRPACGDCGRLEKGQKTGQGAEFDDSHDLSLAGSLAFFFFFNPEDM